MEAGSSLVRVDMSMALEEKVKVYLPEDSALHQVSQVSQHEAVLVFAPAVVGSQVQLAGQSVVHASLEAFERLLQYLHSEVGITVEALRNHVAVGVEVMDHHNHQVKLDSVDPVLLQALRELRNAERELISAVDAHAEHVIHPILGGHLIATVQRSLIEHHLQMGSKCGLEVLAGASIVRVREPRPQVGALVALGEADVLAQSQSGKEMSPDLEEVCVIDLCKD